jgi:VanZ family protein
MPTSEFKPKPRRLERVIAAILALIVAIVIFALSAVPGSSFPAHPNFLNVVAHFCEYALLAALLTVALNSPRRKLWQSALIALAIASFYGASDEFHQLFVPGRVCDVMDWLTDTAGALAGATVSAWWIAARRVRSSRKRDSEL